VFHGFYPVTLML